MKDFNSRPENISNYPSTLMILACIFAFPPLGTASTRLQTKHRTLVLAQPNITCSLPQSGHETLTNLDLGSGTNKSFRPITIPHLVVIL